MTAINVPLILPSQLNKLWYIRTMSEVVRADWYLIFTIVVCSILLFCVLCVFASSCIYHHTRNRPVDLPMEEAGPPSRDEVPIKGEMDERFNLP